jgi:membrane protein implicated in regulation of membrane protease activity
MSTVEQIFQGFGTWGWWFAGILLFGVEVLVPGTFFLWFGVAAILVGVINLIEPLAWQANIILFAVLAVISVMAGRWFMRRREDTSGDPGLNRRGSRYAGHVFVLSEPIVSGNGRLAVDDTVWQVTGPDLPAGTRIVVEGVEGVRLKVRPAG